MSISLAHIVSLLARYKYLLLFPVAVIEGPIITVISGFLVHRGYLNFIIAYLTIVSADALADAVYYFIGRKARKRSNAKGYTGKWAARFGVSAERIQKLEERFKKHPGKTLIAGKYIHGPGVALLFAAGAAGIPFFDFMKFSLLGAAFQSFFLLSVGYYFGSAYVLIDRYLHNFQSAMFIIVAAFLILFWAYKTLGGYLSGKENLSE